MWRQAVGFAAFSALLTTFGSEVVGALVFSWMRGSSGFFAVSDIAGYKAIGVSFSPGANLWVALFLIAGIGAVIGFVTGALLWAVGIRMVTQPGSRFARIVCAGTAGVVIGMAPTLAVVATAFSDSAVIDGPPFAVYALSAVLAYALGLAGVYVVLRPAGDPILNETVRAVAAVLPVAAIVAIGAGVGIASLFDFSWSVSTWFDTIVAVVTIIAAGFLVARAWALRHLEPA